MDNSVAISCLRRAKHHSKKIEQKRDTAFSYDVLLLSGKKESRLHKLAFMYVLGGFLGTLWETILNWVRGDGFVFCNGSLFTPFNPVYGFGALMIVLALGNYKKPIAVLVVGSVMGAGVEMLLSYLEEFFMGTRSWDYTGDFLNILGRTSVPLGLFFGTLCVVVVCYVYPSYNRFLLSFKLSTLQRISAVVLLVILLDFACTATVLFRYSDRLHGIEAKNSFDRLLDELFDDKYMRQHFPQMAPGAKKKAKTNGAENKTPDAVQKFKILNLIKQLFAQNAFDSPAKTSGFYKVVVPRTVPV